jgi:uncharacterized damage-inducible protein DinB
MSNESIRGEIDLLRRQVSMTHDAVRKNVEGLTHADSLVQPLPDGNRLNWVMGHLVLVDQRMLRRVGLPQVMPEDALARYSRGTPPLQESDEATDFRTLVDAWNMSQPRLDAGLDALTPAALESLAGATPAGKPTDTVRTLLTTLAFHQAYHAGQTGVLRRMAGKPGAIK